MAYLTRATASRPSGTRAVYTSHAATLSGRRKWREPHVTAVQTDAFAHFRWRDDFVGEDHTRDTENEMPRSRPEIAGLIFDLDLIDFGREGDRRLSTISARSRSISAA